ncbi:MAG: cell division protein FtsZ [Alphaproteobacteria bacterium]|nr:cell division protein FtsZ [Alphaproteobacteria bacterium]
MSINLSVPQQTTVQSTPRIAVIGIGGGGGNAVNNMIESNLEGVDFIVANTDAQALLQSKADRRIQLGEVTTQGLGAGANPTVGKVAAEESIDEVMKEIEGTNMLFIAAGMGGGTGTGATSVIAQAARERGILTIGVVTKPFTFEGKRRMEQAKQGIEELTKHVDTLIIIPNQNLFYLSNKNTTFAEAFKIADEVLHSGVRSVTDLMIMPGLINLDFSDVRTVMSEMGKAMMGSGEAEGESRAKEAAEMAISNPLLDDASMKGARGVLINITGGNDITLFEVDEAANIIREQVDEDANIIFGSCFDENLDGKIRVSVVATGIDVQGVAIKPIAALSSIEVAVKPELQAEVQQETPKRQEFFEIDNKPIKTAWVHPLRRGRGGDVSEEKSDVEAILETETVIESVIKPAVESSIEVETQAIETEIQTIPENSEAIPSMPHATELFAESMEVNSSSNIQKNISEEATPFKPHIVNSNGNETPIVEKYIETKTSMKDAFIPAAPAEPMFAKNMEEPYLATEIISNNNDVSEQEKSKSEAKSSSHTPTLFERVTGLSITRNTRPDANKKNEPNYPPAATEEELEIPAFLRRKL